MPFGIYIGIEKPCKDIVVKTYLFSLYPAGVEKDAGHFLFQIEKYD